MPIDLTEDEKAKFAEYQKDLGYDDHASKTIARLNAEAKAQRLEREKIEAEAKALRDADAERKAAEDKRRAEDEAEKKRAEDEKKSVDDRIRSLEETFHRELTTREETAAKKQQELLDELGARDRQVLVEAVRSAAVKRGIIDEEIVALLDLSTVKIEKGRPDRAAIDTLIEEHAKAKPALYKSEKQRQRDDDGRFSRPEPDRDSKSKVAWEALSDEEFEKQEARLRAGRL